MDNQTPMKAAVPVSDSTAPRALENQLPGFTISRNADGQMLDIDGNVTLSLERANKIWRRTRLPDPEGEAKLYLITLKGEPADPDKRVMGVTLYGQNFPRHVYRANPDNPRQPDRVYQIIAMADNQHEVLMERAATEKVRIPPKYDEGGEIAIDEETGERVRDEKWIPMSELLDLIPYYGDLAAVGAGGDGGLVAMKRIQALETECEELRAVQPNLTEAARKKLQDLQSENAKLREEQAPAASPEEALRELLYSANLMNSDDDGPMSEHLSAIADRLSAVKRDFPEKGKGKGKNRKP